MSEEQQKQLEELQTDLMKANERAENNLEGWKRAKADYLNLVKDQDKKTKEAFTWANAAFMSEILPVFNHFKLALEHIPQELKKESWFVGIELIGKQFKDFLSKYKITEIKTIGEKFNPEIHEALTHETKEGFDVDVVFEEVSPGYLLEDKVLMPAKVKVAK